jgi:hypothetical protein
MTNACLAPRLPTLAAALVAVVTLGRPAPVLAQDHTPLKCPAGSVYRETRRDAGGNDFCERVMPGGLRVNEGPARFWFNMEFVGEEGNYKNGRKVGHWKECDRFERCHDETYPDIDEEPVRPGATRDLPVRYVGGKYLFDFGSCWTTWMTHGEGDSAVDLNIGGSGPFRCEITYITPWQGRENDHTYFCRIPFAVGVRALDSIDLRQELPKLGLPQFCGEPGQRSTPLILSVKMPVRLKGGQEQLFFVAAVTDVDVECVSAQPSPDRLVVKLNEFAAAILQGVGGAAIEARTCRDGIELKTRSADHSQLTFQLSSDATIAKRQKSCIDGASTLQKKCAAPR